MFSFGRLLTIMTLGLVVYVGFYAVPPGEPGDGHFDPEALARDEVAVWQAVQGREDFGVFFSLVPMEREAHRYSWFRAAQASFYMARAQTTFAELRGRYERVLPDLEDAAALHKAWVKGSFDAPAVARAQLDWWVTRRMPNLNSIDQIAPLIAREYALRYQVTESQAADAAFRRAQAMQLFDADGADPRIAAITKLLAESHASLQESILQPRRAR